MTAKAFLDTNVLVYLFDNDEGAKQSRARTLMADSSFQFVVSTQVLGEFYVVVTRRLRRPLDPPSAGRAVERISELFVVGTDAAMVRAAVRTSQRSQISYWDSLIIEAAASADCELVLTEDLAHGSSIRGVRIQNPFQPT